MNKASCLSLVSNAILYWNTFKIDDIVGELRDQGVYFILSKRRKQAKVAEFTPQDMRRSFAGDLLDAGADISTVQKLMGHSSADTTVGYDRRGERAKREAVRHLHVPYSKR